MEHVYKLVNTQQITLLPPDDLVTDMEDLAPEEMAEFRCYLDRRRLTALVDAAALEEDPTPESVDLTPESVDPTPESVDPPPVSVGSKPQPTKSKPSTSGRAASTRPSTSKSSAARAPPVSDHSSEWDSDGYQPMSITKPSDQSSDTGEEATPKKKKVTGADNIKTEDGKGKGKGPRICPAIGCHATPLNLTRHLRTVHHYVEQKVREVSLLTKGRGHGKVNRKRKPCPICGRVLIKVPQHLNKFHKMDNKSEAFKKHLLKIKKDSKWQQPKAASSKGEDSALRSSDSEHPWDELSVNVSSDVGSSCGEEVTTSIVVTKGFKVAKVGSTLSADSVKPFFAAFKCWLMSLANPNAIAEKDAVYRLANMQRILSEDTESTRSLQRPWDIFDVDCIQQYFSSRIADSSSKFAASTQQQYFYACRDFAGWMKLYVRGASPPVDEMLDAETAYKAAVKRRTGDRRAEKGKRMVDLSAHIPSVCEVNNYFSSAYAKKCTLIGNRLLDDPVAILSPGEYCDLRDHLLMSINLHSAHRSGVFATLTLQHYKARVIYERDSKTRVVPNNDHKNKRKDYTPANVVITEPTLSVFKQFIMNQVPRMIEAGGRMSNLFVTRSGRAMTSGAITRCMNSAWRKAGNASHFSATIYRIAMVTLVHHDHPDMKEDAASHMKSAIEVEFR